MRVMSAGQGFRYLLSSVAAGDGHRPLTTPLIAYYTEKGTPPGYWLGTGVHSRLSGQTGIREAERHLAHLPRSRRRATPTVHLISVTLMYLSGPTHPVTCECP